MKYKIDFCFFSTTLIHLQVGSPQVIVHLISFCWCVLSVTPKHVAGLRLAHDISSCTVVAGGGCYYKVASRGGSQPSLEDTICQKQQCLRRLKRAYLVHQYDGNEAGEYKLSLTWHDDQTPVTFCTVLQRCIHIQACRDRQWERDSLLCCALLTVTCCQHGQTRFQAHARRLFSLCVHCLLLGLCCLVNTNTSLHPLCRCIYVLMALAGQRAEKQVASAHMAKQTTLI